MVMTSNVLSSCCRPQLAACRKLRSCGKLLTFSQRKVVVGASLPEGPDRSELNFEAHGSHCQTSAGTGHILVVIKSIVYASYVFGCRFVPCGGWLCQTCSSSFLYYMNWCMSAS